MDETEIWKSAGWIEQTRLLLDSYARWLGDQLIERSGDDAEDAKRLFCADCVVVSHGTQDDPVLNYGNARALELWEMDVVRFTSTPSRYTAESVERLERQKLLERTTSDGYVDDYRGIRITSTGKRFIINRAIVWNLVDSSNEYAGQAATFSDWVYESSRAPS